VIVTVGLVVIVVVVSTEEVVLVALEMDMDDLEVLEVLVDLDE